ncbi:MAG TPA: hypothetical protein VLH18_03875, partial [Candidatus Limnocylindrales bacterium]|nr:hypothetical protein [Candidatus Limnocylindrales bacterium]
MKYISLLPPEIKQRRLAERKQGKLLVLLAVSLPVVLAVYLFFLVSTLMLQNDLTALQDERRFIENQSAALEEYALLFDEMTAGELLLVQAMGTVPPWDLLMRDLGTTMPPVAWLSDLSFGYEGEGGIINMRGWAHNHSAAASMLDHLHTLEWLSDIRITTST